MRGVSAVRRIDSGGKWHLVRWDTTRCGTWITPDWDQVPYDSIADRDMCENCLRGLSGRSSAQGGPAYCHPPQFAGRYPGCVLDDEGNCSRWNHDHAPAVVVTSDSEAQR